MNNGVLILLSGGIDSTALINYYLEKNTVVHGLHFQYGQPASSSELISVENISKYYKIDTKVVNLGYTMTSVKGEFLCRNALFILTAATNLPKDTSSIALGVHSGVPYYDCGEDFINDCQRILDGYFAGTVKLEAPFLCLQKMDIFSYCKSKQVPISLTYSCEVQNRVACGGCASCLDRRTFE